MNFSNSNKFMVSIWGLDLLVVGRSSGLLGGANSTLKSRQKLLSPYSIEKVQTKSRDSPEHDQNIIKWRRFEKDDGF